VDEQEFIAQQDDCLDSVETLDAEEPQGNTPLCPEDDGPRLRRIADYELVALAREDPCEAVMETLIAGMLKIELGLQQAIERAMNVTPVTPERIGALAPSFDWHLKYARQIDRYGQLIRRLATPGKMKETQNQADSETTPQSEEMAI